MKKKLKLLSLASMLAVSNISAIEIGPTGSGVEMSGFIDLAFTENGKNTESSSVGQVEVNFDYTSGPISASVDLDFYDSKTEGSTLEEAVVTYDFGNGFSVSAGKMLSYLGFEAYDPPNMFQYSYGYDSNGGQAIYDAYDVGVSFDYGTADYSIGVWTSAENEAGYELSLAFTGVENLTAKAIWSDFTASSTDPYSKSTFWVSYQLDKLLIAAEVAENDQHDSANGNNDVDGWLIMGNYSVSEKVGLTLRYSEEEVSTSEVSTLTSDRSKFTISPSYVFNDNFSGLIEYSTYSDDVTGNTDPEDLFAVELIYTF